jgi:hypothetical protein
VNARHARLGHQRSRVVSRHEPAELLERAGRDVHRSAREHDVVGIPRGRVGGRAVHGQALLVELAERRQVAGQRTRRARDPLPSLCHVDLEEYGDRVVPQRLPDALRPERAAAERDHRGPRVLQRLDRDVLLRLAEPLLPALLEDLGDGLAALPLELRVDVDERPADALGNLGPHGRLAGAHEADQHEVPSV